MSRLDFDPQTRSLVVKAKIEGEDGVQYASLIFDTGASNVILPWKIATSVGLEIDPERTIRSITASTIEGSPLTYIPKLSVLGQTVENVECLVRDLPPQSTVDGLLGLTFLNRFNTVINFEEGFLEITPTKNDS